MTRRKLALLVCVAFPIIFPSIEVAVLDGQEDTKEEVLQKFQEVEGDIKRDIL